MGFIERLRQAEKDYRYTPSHHHLALEFGKKVVLDDGSILLAKYDFKACDHSDQIWERGSFLSLHEVFGISQNLIFIGGEVDVARGAVRSVLLRSQDGGKNWIEVKVPRNCGAVTGLIFVDHDHGWVMETEYYEGAGNSSLFGTTDGGLSWHMVNESMPCLSGGAWMTIGLNFSTRMNGSIWAEQPSTYPTRTYDEDFCKYITKDGGKSWASTDKCYNSEVLLQHIPKQDIVSSITDQSQWRIVEYKIEAGARDSEQDSLFLIYRRLSPKANWELRLIIPAELRFEGGFRHGNLHDKKNNGRLNKKGTKKLENQSDQGKSGINKKNNFTQGYDDVSPNGETTISCWIDDETGLMWELEVHSDQMLAQLEYFHFLVRNVGICQKQERKTKSLPNSGSTILNNGLNPACPKMHTAGKMAQVSFCNAWDS